MAPVMLVQSVDPHVRRHTRFIIEDVVDVIDSIFYRVAKTHLSLKLLVIFRKRATNCKTLLQEMTNKASHESSPPCQR